MKALSGGNWLKKPWRLMSYGDCYRHYAKRTDKYEENLIVIRTSDVCYCVIRWKVPFARYPKPTIYKQSFRSFNDVIYYASREIH